MLVRDKKFLANNKFSSIDQENMKDPRKLKILNN